MAAPNGYYRTLSALTNTVSWVDLTASNFDFGMAKSDGSDLRVYDVTGAAAIPIWLSDYDATARTGRIFFKATSAGNTHRLYYGDVAASATSSFSGVFTSGTGFDSGWGDLTTGTSGAGAATRLAAWDGTLTSARYRQVYRRSNTAAVGTSQWANRPCVREFSILTDAYNNIVQDGGVYVAYYIGQNTGNDPTFPGQTYRCTSTDLVTWTNHTLAIAAGPGTFDDLAARVATAQKWSAGVYKLWYTSTGTVTSGVAMATSTDGLTWSKSGLVLTSANCGITDVAPLLSGVPDVVRLLDGTYAMLNEARTTSGTGYPWRVYGWSSPDGAAPWTVLNGGAALISQSNGMTTWGAANPHLWQRGANDFLILAQGFSGSDGTLSNFNGNVGWWTNTSLGSAFTFDGNGPIAGRINVTPSNFGTETSGLALLSSAPITHIQDYPAPDNLNTLSNVYRIYPVTDRCGLFLAAADADAAVASMTVAAGAMTAEHQVGMTTHRSGDNTVYCLALADSATAVAAGTSSTVIAKLRVAVRRSTFCSSQSISPTGPSPGDISFLYWDASAVIHYYNGAGHAWGTTSTSVASSSDCLREIVARIDDDGTNFILGAFYADTMGVIVTAVIAKASVKAFSSGRALLAGIPFTNTNYGGAYSRRISVRPYAASEPTLTLGARLPSSRRLLHGFRQTSRGVG